MPARTLTHGWNPDLPDPRDHRFRAPRPGALPPAADLRSRMPPVYDQGRLGSCTANAIGAALEYLHVKEGLGDLRPSRLFIYYNERSLEGTVATDSGARIRDGIKTVNRQGACAEATWPYVEAKFREKPPERAYAEGRRHVAVAYERLATLDDFRTCLAAADPVALGFSVPASFEGPEVARTGRLPMPAAGERILGGHAVLAVGYDDRTSCLLVRNSWGAAWGVAGHFWMPYGYVEQGLADDFWTIRVVK